jgi:SAM-dependent methyltransferase
MIPHDQLAARIEPFDSFWEAPDDIESGYHRFGRFYRANYLHRLPGDRSARILCVSCGPGYLVQLLGELGYRDVLGIDSFPDKIAWAERRELPCRVARAFEFLDESPDAHFDVIFCEQELNHLTRTEILAFLALCRRKLRPGGLFVCFALNGANPITGAEALAQNFDHFNTFTEYSLRQVLEHSGLADVEVFGLNLYVFPANPFNWVARLVSALYTAFFRASFILYGKKNRIFTKKIGAVGRRNP